MIISSAPSSFEVDKIVVKRSKILEILGNILSKKAATTRIDYLWEYNYIYILFIQYNLTQWPVTVWSLFGSQKVKKLKPRPTSPSPRPTPQMFFYYFFFNKTVPLIFRIWHLVTEIRCNWEGKVDVWSFQFARDYTWSDLCDKVDKRSTQTWLEDHEILLQIELKWHCTSNSIEMSLPQIALRRKLNFLK
jgi:hypothetical protein